MSSYAIAGIKDKKAIKGSEKTIATATANVKAACGNAKLDAKIDWNNWEKYDYKKMNTTKQDVLRFTGGLAESVLNSMAKLCKDPDYKAELAKITLLNFDGKKDQKSMYVAYKLEGNKLAISLNADGVSSWKNANLLKAVWE
jgi:hypothetical protein